MSPRQNQTRNAVSQRPDRRAARSRLPVGLCLLIALLNLPLSAGAADLIANETLGLRHPPGFKVSIFADQELANDIFAMTLDSQGRVVVSGPGYIKRLEDTNGDGQADRAVMFGTTRTGGMGLCFDGNDLISFGDGALSRYRDANGDGIADGPPEILLKSNFGEHGTHAIRQGPDGWWYLIGGNDAGFGAKNATVPIPRIRDSEGGCLLRLSPDFKVSDIIAQGFRNPYDFDFNASGDLFTYDSDCERDYFLPWYTPTRLYHVGVGQHHGWRLNGYLRSWARRDYYWDTVEMLAPVGRGSPTGVTCYRHRQFPGQYWGGIFALDWTFGKVWFAPLSPRGATYDTRPELFLEPLGTQGFAPTDVAVAPDGSLLIAIGGRKTRGAVYRVEASGGSPKTALNASPLIQVLDAPQPLDAWSRAQWLPLARQVGRDAFARVVYDAAYSASQRVRAIEILTELFHGLPTGVARAALTSGHPAVRARAAWSVGVEVPSLALMTDLCRLAAEDPVATVRLHALEALTAHFTEITNASPVKLLASRNGTLQDKRVQQALERLLARLPAQAQTSITPNERLGHALELLWRDPTNAPHAAAIEEVMPVLTRPGGEDQRLRAVRLLMLALGDYHLHNPSVEVFTAYEPAASLSGHPELAERILGALRPLFPSGSEPFDSEAARLLAMLEDPADITPAKVLAKITPATSPTDDLHYLIVLARLRGSWLASTGQDVVDALLRLERKLGGQELRTKQVWGERLAELARELARRHAEFSAALLAHPALVKPGHVGLIAALGDDERTRAASLFLAAAKTNRDFVWSGALIELLGRLPVEEIRPVFRSQWANLGLRDALVAQLARLPVPEDKARFLDRLASADVAAVVASASALNTLSDSLAPTELAQVTRALRRALAQPAAQKSREALLTLLARKTGATFSISETGLTLAQLPVAYAPVFEWFNRAHPDLAATVSGANDPDATKWNETLAKVAWEKGDATRGEVLFRERACQTCHSGPAPIGPNLAGAASRFSPADLFAAIVFPSRDIAPAYCSTTYRLRDGQTHTGLMAFESADGVIIQTGATTTVRLPDADIIARETSELSLMPAGLLDGLSPEDLASLHAYLRGLKNPNP